MMKRTMPAARLLFAMLAVLLHLPAALAQDTIRINERTVYYDITGETMDEIARSIKQRRSDSLDGFIGETTFHFKWNYSYASNRDASGKASCTVSGTNVVIDIAVNLPRHKGIAGAPEDIRDFWQDFSTALEKHERNHARDFVATGSLIPEAIDGTTAPNCMAVQSAANAVGMEYVDRAQRQADDYDARTNHGLEEGARFPGF